MKNDNQTMDRAIPVSEQRRRKLRRAAVAVAIAIAVLGAGAWLGTQMIPTLDRKALIISEVDRGTIDVSVSATGRIVPAFEEIIVSPISSKILEVYAHSGDSVTSARPCCASTCNPLRPTTPRPSTSARFVASRLPSSVPT